MALDPNIVNEAKRLIGEASATPPLVDWLVVNAYLRINGLDRVGEDVFEVDSPAYASALQNDLRKRGLVPDQAGFGG